MSNLKFSSVNYLPIETWMGNTPLDQMVACIAIYIHIFIALIKK